MRLIIFFFCLFTFSCNPVRQEKANRLLILDSSIKGKTSAANSSEIAKYLKHSMLDLSPISQNKSGGVDTCFKHISLGATAGILAAEAVSKGCSIGGLVLVPVTAGLSGKATLVCGVADITYLDSLIGGGIGSVTGFGYCVVNTLSDFPESLGRVFQAKKEQSTEPEDQTFSTKKAARRKALRDAGIPNSQTPEKVEDVPVTDSDGKVVLDEDGRVVMGKEETYTTNGRDRVVLQDHPKGHHYNRGDQSNNDRPHFHVRPSTNTRTGKLPGVSGHYFYP